jgi:hypothetical protein
MEDVLAWIIHELSLGFVSLAERAMNAPEKVNGSPHRGSKRPKSVFPYSSTKLNFMNNPG